MSQSPSQTVPLPPHLASLLEAKMRELTHHHEQANDLEHSIRGMVQEYCHALGFTDSTFSYVREQRAVRVQPTSNQPSEELPDAT
jgi:hypothetical protein